MDNDLGFIALISHSTWELVPKPKDSKLEACKWDVMVKYKPDAKMQDTRLFSLHGSYPNPFKLNRQINLSVLSLLHPCIFLDVNDGWIILKLYSLMPLAS